MLTQRVRWQIEVAAFATDRDAAVARRHRGAIAAAFERLHETEARGLGRGARKERSVRVRAVGRSAKKFETEDLVARNEVIARAQFNLFALPSVHAVLGTKIANDQRIASIKELRVVWRNERVVGERDVTCAANRVRIGDELVAHALDAIAADHDDFRAARRLKLTEEHRLRGLMLKRHRRSAASAELVLKRDRRRARAANEGTGLLHGDRTLSPTARYSYPPARRFAHVVRPAERARSVRRGSCGFACTGRSRRVHSAYPPSDPDRSGKQHRKREP